jgi:hypothetical protein
MAAEGKFLISYQTSSINPRNINLLFFTLFVTPADVGSVLSVEEQVKTLLFSTSF